MTDFSSIKIFYDGNNFEKYANYPHVVGFTTNSTFIKQSGFTSYSTFISTTSKFIDKRPISLQITSDNNIEEQARQLYSYGDNVYVKISVLNTKGEYNIPIIKKLNADGVKINITCVYTEGQLFELAKHFQNITTPLIISIFAGGISDAGLDPLPTVKTAVSLFKDTPVIEILWAGCKDNLSIINTVKTGCHIITLPDSIMDRMNRIGLDLSKMTIDKVKLFNSDATNLTVF